MNQSKLMVMNGNVAVTAGYVNKHQCESNVLYLGVNMIFYTFHDIFFSVMTRVTVLVLP